MTLFENVIFAELDNFGETDEGTTDAESDLTRISDSLGNRGISFIDYCTIWYALKKLATVTRIYIRLLTRSWVVCISVPVFMLKSPDILNATAVEKITPHPSRRDINNWLRDTINHARIDSDSNTTSVEDNVKSDGRFVIFSGNYRNKDGRFVIVSGNYRNKDGRFVIFSGNYSNKNGRLFYI